MDRYTKCLRDTLVVSILAIATCFAGGASVRQHLDRETQYRGMAFLSSDIGPDISPDEVCDFVQTTRTGLVVMDFAWITYHWPRTTPALADIVRRLSEAGVEVAVMYRPRVLSPSEADIHYAVNADGTIPPDHNELCFAYEDSVAWGAEWGTRLLKAYPSVNEVIIYNLRAPCCCDKCRNGQGQLYAAQFLERCRTEWKLVRPAVQIGHVGIGTEYAAQVDFLCPFLALNRQGDVLFDVPGALAGIAAVKREAGNKPVIPLVKVCWEGATNNTTEDVASTIEGCERAKIGYILWYYGWLFHPEGRRYEPRTLLTALGGEWQRMARYFSPAAVRRGTGPAASRNRPIAAPNLARSAGTSQVPDLTFPYTETQMEKLPWPHQPPGLAADAIDTLNRAVWVINDFPLYQADEQGLWRYFHGGFDIVLDNGTRIYAMKDGWVKAIAFSSIIIADARDNAPAYGWEYTHLGNFQVKTGDFVKKGMHLGDVNFTGLPHIHLGKVFSQAPYWGTWHYQCMPNSHFTYVDNDPPVIKKPFYFFRNNADTMLQPDSTGHVTVSGNVDIVVGIREAGQYARSQESGFGDRLGVARVDYVISPVTNPQGTKYPLRSFDFTRLAIKAGSNDREYSTRLTQIAYKHWDHFETSRPIGSQTFSYYILTNCSGQEPPVELKPEDENYSWSTMALDKEGNRLCPDGEYEIAVTAHDFAGHATTEVMRVTVANGSRGSSSASRFRSFE